MRPFSMEVPWCVPQWGLDELIATLAGSVAADQHAPYRLAEEVAKTLGVPYAFGTGSGATAIELALRALGVEPGDEVVLPSYLCRSVLTAVHAVRAQPVFCDVGANLQVTPDLLAAVLSKRTKVAILSHLFGDVADAPTIERLLRGKGVAMIDDAAQSFGATIDGRKVGSFGDVGVVSCGPGKPLAGSGGGVLVTRDAALARRVGEIMPAGERSASRRRVWSFWGRRRFRRVSHSLVRVFARIGVNSSSHSTETAAECARVSRLEASIALVQLRKLETNSARRREHASAFLAALGPLAKYNVVDTSGHRMAMKLALVLPAAGPRLDAARSAMLNAGIECQRGYTPLHLIASGARGQPFRTDEVWERVLCVPLEMPLRSPGRLEREVLRLTAVEPSLREDVRRSSDQL